MQPTNSDTIFVGRKEPAKQLHDLISSHIHNNDKRVRIISVFGKSGVGKSFLVDHALKGFETQLRQHLIIRISYATRGAYSLESIFTGQVPLNSNTPLINFKQIQKTRKVIENIDRKFIETSVKDKGKNTEISKKLLSEANIIGIKGFLSYIKNKAGIDDLGISDDDIRKLLNNLPNDSYNNFDRIFNTKKYRVDNNLTRELANDFLRDIRKITKKTIFKKNNKKSLIFILDDYEGLRNIIEPIFSELIGPLKNEKFNSLFVFIGREELGWNTSWRVYDDTKEPSIELKIFSDDEANEYLQQTGILDTYEREKIIKKSHKLPLLLEILAYAKKNKTEAKWIEDYFERITAHMDKQQKEWLKKISFLDTRVDLDTIEIMLQGNIKEAEKAFEWFKKEGTAYINTPDGWEVDTIVKTLVREKVEKDSLSEKNKYKEFAEQAQKRYEELKRENP